MNCKNCGHEIIVEKTWINHKRLGIKGCYCGCTNPEPKEVTK